MKDDYLRISAHTRRSHPHTRNKDALKGCQCPKLRQGVSRQATRAPKTWLKVGVTAGDNTTKIEGQVPPNINPISNAPGARRKYTDEAAFQ